jgi:hypothetical protein
VLHPAEASEGRGGDPLAGVTPALREAMTAAARVGRADRRVHVTPARSSFCWTRTAGSTFSR